MRILRAKGLLAFAFAFGGSPASAFLDEPYLTPANPIAGEVVHVNIRGGECDAIVGIEGYPQITRQGNVIRVVFFSVHYDDTAFCTLGTGTASVAVGSYPPGNYTLQIERRYMTPAATWIQEALGVIPLNVRAPQHAVETPALNSFGLTALLLTLTATVLRLLRIRLA